MAELLLKAHMYKYSFSIHKVFGIIITIILRQQLFAFIFTGFFFLHIMVSLIKINRYVQKYLNIYYRKPLEPASTAYTC